MKVLFNNFLEKFFFSKKKEELVWPELPSE